MAALKKGTALIVPAVLSAFFTGTAGIVSAAPRPQGAVRLEDGLIVGYLWPLRGEASSSWGKRTDPISPDIERHHSGLDIAAPEGARVTASRAGRVTFAGADGSYGNAVIVRHSKDTETLYGHLSAIRVRKDVFVRPGQVLGTVGSTGRSTGYHLHFEIRVGGRAVDPAKWLVPPGYMMPPRGIPSGFDVAGSDKRR